MAKVTENGKKPVKMTKNGRKNCDETYKSMKKSVKNHPKRFQSDEKPIKPV